MDTDELSEEAYKGILLEAEKFNHDLTLQFGVLSYECRDEKEYLDKSFRLADEIKDLPGELLTDIFFGVIPERKGLQQTLDRIQENITRVKTIPEAKRTHREW